MDPKQEKMIALMREILQDDYIELAVERYTHEEDLESGASQITCKLQGINGEPTTIEGKGVGLIDALFNGLRDRLASDYPSLTSISFSQFDIEGLISSELESSSESMAQATVGIRNSEGQEFIFKSTAPSVSRAGIEASLLAAAYFVNSEKTYVRLHEILEHYRSDGRMDLVEKYTELMSRVVENTSYSEVVERIRSQM
jgi:hypothetical protein